MRRRQYSIKKNLCEIHWNGVDWIYLAEVKETWSAIVNKAVNILTVNREFIN
jgi:hypothetical protein